MEALAATGSRGRATRLRCGRPAVLLPLAMLATPSAAEVPKDEYLRYVPLEYRRVVRQTEA